MYCLFGLVVSHMIIEAKQYTSECMLITKNLYCPWVNDEGMFMLHDDPSLGRVVRNTVLPSLIASVKAEE